MLVIRPMNSPEEDYLIWTLNKIVSVPCKCLQNNVGFEVLATVTLSVGIFIKAGWFGRLTWISFFMD